MPKPTLKQRLLRQPTHSYVDYEQQQNQAEPYWIAAKRRERELAAQQLEASRSTTSLHRRTVSGSSASSSKYAGVPYDVTRHIRPGSNTIRSAPEPEPEYSYYPQQQNYSSAGPSVPKPKTAIAHRGLSQYSPDDISASDSASGSDVDESESDDQSTLTDVSEHSEAHSEVHSELDHSDTESQISVYYTPPSTPAPLSRPLPTPVVLSASVTPLSRAETSRSSSVPTSHSTSTCKSDELEDMFSFSTRSRSWGSTSDVNTAFTSPAASEHDLTKTSPPIPSSSTSQAPGSSSQFLRPPAASQSAPTLPPAKRVTIVESHSPRPRSTISLESKSKSASVPAAARSRRPRPESMSATPMSSSASTSAAPARPTSWIPYPEPSPFHPPRSTSLSPTPPPDMAPTPTPRPRSRHSSLTSLPQSQSSSTSSLPADHYMYQPSRKSFVDVPLDLDYGTSATIGIPFSNPETGLPILHSIISVSRQSMGSVSEGQEEPEEYAVPTADSFSYSLSRKKSGSRRKGGASTPSSMQRTIRGQMSFILEEDESPESASASASGSASGSGTASEAGSAPARTTTAATSANASAISLSTRALQEQDRRRSRTMSLPSIQNQNRSSVIKLDTPAPSVIARSESVRSSSTTTRSHGTRTQYQSDARTVGLPFPLPAQHGQPHFASRYARSEGHASSVGSDAPFYAQSPGQGQGYTSLVLARAAFAPSKHPDRVSSTIDITKSGLATTSMGTIEIVRGAADQHHSHGIFGGSVSSLLLMKGSGSSAKGSGGGRLPKHMREKESVSPLAFSARLPPPSRLPPSQVLVQIFMVGLDGLDALVVQDKASGGAGYGFIPGRGFVGRAVECGFEVRNVCKGDWVFGLLDLHKCGALAEFLTVDRRRVCRAPTPSSSLSLEQIALLPICGIPAHRAIRTLAGAGPGKTALVLNAHDGIGGLLAQSLAQMGVDVIAHVFADAVPVVSSASTPVIAPEPRKFVSSNDSSDEDEDEDEDERTPGNSIPSSPTTATGPTSFPLTNADRARHYGASPPIMAGDALVVLAAAQEASVDFVLDTAGGRRIWDAARWVLVPGGQFTTLVGDKGHLSPAYEGSSLKSSMRSIRSAMSRRDSTSSSKSKSKASAKDSDKEKERRKASGSKDGKGYEWVMPNAELDTEGEDVRDSLAAVAQLASQGRMVPLHCPAVPFEQTPDAFIARAKELANGGCFVVKLIG